MFTVAANLTYIPGLSEDEFGEAVYGTGMKAAKLAYDDVADHLLEDVREYPPSPNRKMEWVSEAQKRWARWAYMAGILPYVRTFDYQRGWVFTEPQLKDGKITVILKNGDLRNYRNENYFPFVGGGLMQNNANQYQQRFHTITGWKQVQPIADSWLLAYIDRFKMHLDELLQKKMAELFRT